MKSEPWTRPEPEPERVSYQLLQVLFRESGEPVPLLLELVPGGFGNHGNLPRLEPSSWFRGGATGSGVQMPEGSGSDRPVPEPQQVQQRPPSHASEQSGNQGLEAGLCRT